MTTTVRIVLVTAPSAEVGTRLARALVAEHLAACVNLLPGVHSIYRWHDELQESDEVMLVIKTRDEVVDTLRERVVALHPYEVPEFIVLPVVGGLESYLSWIRAETIPPTV